MSMSLLKRLNSETPGSTGSMSPRPSGPAPTPSTGNLTTGELFTRSTPSSTSNPSTGELFSPTQNISRQTTGLSESSQSARAKSPRSDNFNELKARVQNRLIAELDPRMDLGNAEEVRRTVEDTFASVLEAEGISLTRVERMRLFEAISAEILGFGPIEPLLKDPDVNEVMVNGPHQVYVERRGKLELTDVTFQ